jgi:hypothetical protein
VIDMGFVHLDAQAVPAVLAAREAGEVIDHLTASMIVEAFTWGWATCWFAETGNFAVATQCLTQTCAGEPYEGRDPVADMDEALWWWMDGPGGHSDPYDNERMVPILREEMRKYMAARWQDGAGECGPVEGWATKPFA